MTSSSPTNISITTHATHMHNYKMTIAYDGTCYSGWQIQPNAPTIQEIIQQKIGVALRKPVQIIGSGRTDSGVHAKGQVAHFHFDDPIDLYRFHNSLNALLPPDIRIKEIVEVPHDFHAQYSAQGKIYHYHICLNKFVDPFKRLYTLHVREKIDINKILHASQYFLGTHNFTSFANEAHSGSAAHDPIRTIQRLEIIEEADGIRLEFEADGFLYKMIRNIVGTLLDVASNKLKAEAIPDIIFAQDRRKAGKAAPSHGLFLVKVKYLEF